MVERMHRQLKAALMARTTGANWTDQLLFVLLGIRTSWRSALDHSPTGLVTALVYGGSGGKTDTNRKQNENGSSVATPLYIYRNWHIPYIEKKCTNTAF